jgi:hypothetical protein
MKTSSTIPNGLAEAGRQLWASVVDDYDVEEHERLLLTEACRVADRLDAIAAELEGAPLTMQNFKGDPCPNPLLGEARQQGIVFSRLLASLRLPSGDENDATRPQRRGGARGTYTRKFGVAN